MKNFLCRILSLAIILSLCSCKATENESYIRSGESAASGITDSASNISVDVAMGRYVETDVTPDELRGIAHESLGLFTHSNGSIDYFASIVTDTADGISDDLKHFHTDDGIQWTNMDVAWFDEIQIKYKTTGLFLRGLTMDDDQRIYCLFTLGPPDDIRKIVYIENGKDINELPVELDASDNMPAKRISIAGKSNLIVETLGGAIRVYSLPDGKLSVTYPGSGVSSYTIYNDKIAIAAMNIQAKLQVNIYGFENESPTEIFELPNVSDLSTVSFANGDSEDLYIVTPINGVQRLILGSDLVETIMDSSMFSFGNDTIKETHFNSADSAFYFIMLYEDGSERILKYSFDKNIPTTPTIELSVFSMNNFGDVRKAAIEFQRTHPEVNIKYDVGTDIYDVSESEIIRLLNTELLAGKGPDILFLDEMPSESYFEKGILTDLSNYIATDELFENIAESFKTDTGLFAIPTRFLAPVVYGDITMQSLDDLVKAIETGEDSVNGSNMFDVYPSAENSPFTSFYDTSEMFLTLLPACVSGNISTTELNIENIKTYLLSTKRIAKKYNLHVNPELYNDVSETSKSSTDMRFRGVKVGFQNINGFGSLLLPMTTFGQTGATDGTFSSLFCGDYYIPTQIISINKFCSQKDIAADFINTMIDNNTQSIDIEEGLPINTTSFNFLLAKELEKTNSSLQTDFFMLCNNLSFPILYEKKLYETIYEEAIRYYNDDIEIDETINAINDKTRIYLAEKR